MTKRIFLGMLTPSSNTALEPITTAMLAELPEVSAHFSRFKVTEIALSSAALAQFDNSEILRAAELLAHAKVDAIGWNGTSSGWLGFDADIRLCEQITAATGIPATTSMLALNEILEKISSSVDRETSPEKKLASFARAKFQHMRHAVNLINLDREAVEERPRKAEQTRERLFESEVDIVAAILKEGAEKGVFTINDLLLTARAICHALRGFELTWLVRESEERIEQYLDELLKVLFVGIVSEEGRRMGQRPALL